LAVLFLMLPPVDADLQAGRQKRDGRTGTSGRCKTLSLTGPASETRRGLP
jgi:hypothetical protein